MIFKNETNRTQHIETSNGAVMCEPYGEISVDKNIIMDIELDRIKKMFSFKDDEVKTERQYKRKKFEVESI